MMLLSSFVRYLEILLGVVIIHSYQGGESSNSYPTHSLESHPDTEKVLTQTGKAIFLTHGLYHLLQVSHRNSELSQTCLNCEGNGNPMLQIKPEKQRQERRSLQRNAGNPWGARGRNRSDTHEPLPILQNFPQVKQSP